MRNVERNDACPCGSGRKFKKCCGPALDGSVWPDTPEGLMRSRYSAYVAGDVDHLMRTWHPDSPALKGTDPAQFRRELLDYCREIEFTGLTVSEVIPADDQGVARVRFTATYRRGGGDWSMTELSDFVRYDGRWVYLTGR